MDFKPVKIAAAMGKAFRDVRGGIPEEKLQEMTDKIVEELEGMFMEKTPSVEEVQDVVERRIMTEGFYDVAKHYILYRYDHAILREEKKKDTLEKIEKNDLFVVKRSGKRERFSLFKLKKTLSYAVEGYEDEVDSDVIATQCQLELYDGIKTRDIMRSLVMTARSLIELDPAYSHVAARLLRFMLYKDVIGPEVINFHNLSQGYREAFKRNLRFGVEIGRLDPRLLEFDLDELANSLVIERDELFKYLGAQTLYDRYLLQNPDTREVLETPQAFWMRVAMGLSILEKDINGRAKEFYGVLSTLRFVSSTPTLFHAGTLRPQLSSCFLNIVEDSLDHIFKCISDNAQLAKWSAGIGTDWTNLRGTGALIRGTGVESQGVIPFLKIANDATHAINRSGRRRGAACAYLETWHADIEDFLELRKNTGDERRRTPDMDTANWIPDLFMKRVREDGEWMLFSSEETPDLHHIYGKTFEERYIYYESLAREGKLKLTKTRRARDLWKKMLAMLFETGHPWITFKDPSNIRSPQDHAGVIHSSNLCTEITLNTSPEETAVCNLGSVNLSRHIKEVALDEALMQSTIQTAMRMLDNVIDINFYPTIEGKVSNNRHRPVGVGVMGLQDALFMLNIPFDSEEAVRFSDESMELVSFHAIATSARLAGERGAYASYKDSKWDRGILPQDTLDLLASERGIPIDVPRPGRLNWDEVRELIRKNGMRNSNCIAIAPTATISNISGCFPSIEPIYKNIYVKSNVSGDFIVVNPYLIEDLKKINLWDYEMLAKIKFYDGSIKEIPQIPERIRVKYKEVFDIDPKWIIKAAAYRGRWIDQSQSLNIFFIGTSGKQLSEIYMYAWEMGLKTTYYLRTLAASQVEKSTVDTVKFGSTHVRKHEEKKIPAELPSNIIAPFHEPVAVVASLPIIQPPMASAGVLAGANGAVNLCRIDDPNCESCQ